MIEREGEVLMDAGDLMVDGLVLRSLGFEGSW